MQLTTQHPPAKAHQVLDELMRHLDTQALLIVDSSGSVAHVGLWYGQPASYLARQAPAASQPCTYLVPMIEEVLQQANLSCAQVGALLVGVGPGSFTGLRIALSTVKGIAMGVGCPIYSLPSSALCLGVHEANAMPSAPQVVLLYDGRMGQWLLSWQKIEPLTFPTRMAVSSPWWQYKGQTQHLGPLSDSHDWLQAHQERFACPTPRLYLGGSSLQEPLLPDGPWPGSNHRLEQLVAKVQQPIYPIEPMMWAAPLLLAQRLVDRQFDPLHEVVPRYGPEALQIFQGDGVTRMG